MGNGDKIQVFFFYVLTNPVDEKNQNQCLSNNRHKIFRITVMLSFLAGWKLTLL